MTPRIEAGWRGSVSRRNVSGRQRSTESPPREWKSDFRTHHTLDAAFSIDIGPENGVNYPQWNFLPKRPPLTIFRAGAIYIDKR